MDQPGRYRSRISRPSGIRPPQAGLRPPSAIGAASAASPCPAQQGIAPCPGSAEAGRSRIPQIQSPIPRPVSRLPGPRIPRAASPPRTRAPSPQRGAIPKRSGLMPPGSFVAASKLPCCSTAIPQPKPKSEAPAASMIPVARVVSPAPRATSPARTLAVPIPLGPSAAATPKRQMPYLSPRRKRKFLQYLERKYVRTPPTSPGAEDRRLIRTPPASPVVEAPESPGEAAAVINQVFTNAAAALDQQEKEEEVAVATALHLIQDQRRQLVLSPEAASQAIATQVISPTTRYIDTKWDTLMRDLYGDQYADSLPRPPLSPITPYLIRSPSSADLDRRWEALQLLSAETPLIEDEEMPEYYSLPPSPARSVEDEDMDYQEAYVLGAIVDMVDKQEEAENARFVGDVTPPDFYDSDYDLVESIDFSTADFEPKGLAEWRERYLPVPLTPQRVWSRRRRILPTLRSPIDSPPRYPAGYLKKMYGFRSPKRNTSPFRNPPRETPLQEFIDIDDLEQFLAGTLPIEEEEIDVLEGTWADSEPEEDMDFYQYRPWR